MRWSGHGSARGDHGLGRDAVPQVDCATDDVSLDERHLDTQAGACMAAWLPAGPPPMITKRMVTG